MNEGWIKLHRKILDVPSLKGNYGWLFVVLLLMATHTKKEVMFGGKILKLSPGQFTTGAHQLAVRSNIPRGTVERILKRLKSEERIEVRTDRQCSLITIKNWDTYQQNEEQNEERVRNDRGTSEERVRTKQEREECKKEKNVRKYPYSPQGDERGILKKEESFETFWKSYPRKIGKGAARRSWVKLKCADRLPEILKAIADQKKTDQWLRDGGQFIPHPSTWLNQERWQDEPTERPQVLTSQNILDLI